MAWFYAKHGKQEGPVEEVELRSKLTSGEIGPDDLVWREGMQDWKPAGTVPELAPGHVSSHGAPGGAVGGEPQEPVSPTATQPAEQGDPSQRLGSGTMQPAPGMPHIYTPPATSGLAIASMVCGILSLLTCYVWALVGIPAVVCGHMALRTINRSPTAMEGRGMAIAGLITGYLSIVIQILFIGGLIYWFSRAPFTP